MRVDAKKTLFDALTACEKLDQFSSGKSFEDYRVDHLLKSAVERQFEILGEAFVRLARLSPEVAQSIPGYRRVIGFRNVLIHGYDLVDDEIVWSVLTEKLPELREKITSLLNEPEVAGGDHDA